MASSFDRWEKDPYFSVAEEVQESADRMESMYRTWIHSKKDPSSMWNSEELCRDLSTVLGTTKWQLEEFERAVRSSYSNSNADDARARHREFIVAITDLVSSIENSLQQSALAEGKPPLPWEHLDERESNELALFLSGSSASGHSTIKANYDRTNLNLEAMNKESTLGVTKSSCQLAELGVSHIRGEKPQGHRRTASANADIGAWNISIDDVCPHNSSIAQPAVPPRKIPSVSGFLNTMGTASKLKWPKNGCMALKIIDNQESKSLLVESPQLPRGINACYERSKSCLASRDDCYYKQLYGWYGAIQRLLQRSQYQMQYSRPVQLSLGMTFVCLIGLVLLLAI